MTTVSHAYLPLVYIDTVPQVQLHYEAMLQV